MGKAGHTWLTKDHRARAEHEPLLLQEKISVVWVRGLTHSKKKKGPIKKNVSLKDVLRLLVSKLDEITETIANANGPRYFLLGNYILVYQKCLTSRPKVGTLSP